MVFNKQRRRQSKCHQFRCRRSQPDSADSKQRRQNQHSDEHKHKRAGKCQDCRDHSVGQGSKHSAGKNVKTDKEQSQAAYTVSGYGQIIHRIVRPGKYGCQRSGCGKGEGSRCQGDYGNNL